MPARFSVARAQRADVRLAAGTRASLVGGGTGVAEARTGMGDTAGDTGEEQDLRGVLGTGLGAVPTRAGTAVGGQEASAVGSGTGVAGAVPAGARAAVSRVGGALAECDTRAEAAASLVAEAAPEHPVSASPAATPNTAPIATSEDF